MVVLQFSPQIATDMNLLSSLPANALKEFCKLSIESIRKGPSNKKIYAKAAASLKVEASAVEKAISGMSQVFLVSCQKNLSEADFELSIQDLLPSSQQAELVVEAFKTNFQAIRAELTQIDTKLPHYHDLDWRLDLQLGSRCLMNKVQPKFMLELKTKDSDGEEKKQVLAADYSNLKHMCDELESAIKEAKNKHCNRIVRYVK